MSKLKIQMEIIDNGHEHETRHTSTPHEHVLWRSTVCGRRSSFSRRRSSVLIITGTYHRHETRTVSGMGFGQQPVKVQSWESVENRKNEL